MRVAVPLALLTTLSLVSLVSAENGALDPNQDGGPGHRSRLDFAIVTPASLAHEFQQLAHARRRQGLATRVVTLEAIRDAVPVARDDAERVRIHLRELYQTHGLRWVLLGGDEGVVPMRRATLGRIMPGITELPTDQYYACLDGDWNADGDDRWGESAGPDGPGDSPDLIPELFVGRAPVSTAAEARDFVRRTLHHGEGPAHGRARSGHSPRPLSALLAASVLPVDPFGIDFARFAEDLGELLAADGPWDIHRLYENHTAWPGALPETRDALLAALEDDHDLVALWGAGGRGVFAAGHQPEENVYDEDLRALRSHGRSHVVTMSSRFCDLRSPEALGRALFDARHGSVVSVIGTTELQFVGEGAHLGREYVSHLTAPSRPTLGEALALAVASGSPRHDVDVTRQGTLLLGDPTLRLPAASAGRAEKSAGADERNADDELEPGERRRAMTTDVARPSPPDVNGITTGLVSPDRGVSAGSGGRITAEPASARTLTPGPATELRVVASPVGGPIRLSFSLARPSSRTRLSIFDLSGREIARLLDGDLAAGRSELTWDAHGRDGRRVPPGLYFARLVVPGAASVQRLVVAR